MSMQILSVTAVVSTVILKSDRVTVMLLEETKNPILLAPVGAVNENDLSPPPVMITVSKSNILRSSSKTLIASGDQSASVNQRINNAFCVLP